MRTTGIHELDCIERECIFVENWFVSWFENTAIHKRLGLDPRSDVGDES
jgi:hypothetical protein